MFSNERGARLMQRNQRQKLFLLLIPVFVLALTSCSTPPELPLQPRITFESIEFREVDGPDSLIVSVYFEDGNGDLGLSPFETYPPYHPYDFVLDNNGDTITIGSQPGLPAYNPIDYLILRNQAGEALDTVLVEINENHYNYFIKFFTKRNGRYTEFNWRNAPYYQTFDGRFPLLNTDTDDDGLRERPLEGVLRYGMTSSGWLFVFRDTLKVEVQIQDRALNKSNIVESPDFTLESIRVE